MILRVRSWVRNENGTPNEKSNTFALFIVLLPLIFGVFGLGIDVSRSVYIRNALQNDLDLATVGAAGEASVAAGGTPVINAGPARRTLERMYAINRASGPGLSCTGSGAPVPESGGLPRCWIETVGNFGTNTITFGVREQSRNSFLPIVGVTTQTYNLRSTATLRQRTR